MATSGNYRQFFKQNNTVFGHTIDPRSGFPAQNGMLSATIVCNSAALSDGLATACMIFGATKSRQFISDKKNNVQGLLIYLENDTIKYWISEALKKDIVLVD
jgi:thiamine biosynthesis lipoprotein